LAEIDQNLIRHDLKAAERVRQTARLPEIVQRWEISRQRVHV
jgi:hypothetical protein